MAETVTPGMVWSRPSKTASRSTFSAPSHWIRGTRLQQMRQRPPPAARTLAKGGHCRRWAARLLVRAVRESEEVKDWRTKQMVEMAHKYFIGKWHWDRRGWRQVQRNTVFISRLPSAAI